uniref:non-specific serine/threonine protein kinase n=2 Tax=Xenopus tropicalis TaxID=8364 RepID=A0A803JWN9_XENTR
MPAVTSEGLNDGNLDTVLPQWESQSKEIQIIACFSKMPQESVKNFPHTKRVGNYLVGKMINKGSFAKVMEGLHIPTGQKVAMKVIDKKKAKQDSYVLKNMKREPRIHQMIKHPSIVQLYETLETENSYYMVMELCLGGDLMDRICDKKKLEERDVRRYIRQLLSAVEHLHRHGIVHRDLKIENFLLDENSNIKIVDFGLSNTMRGEGLSPDLLSTQCGSPAYAAPELLANKKYGVKVDVWSIGVSMFAMLTGTLPFTVEPFNIKHLHQKMVNGEISPIPPDISAGAVHFIHMLLEPDPDKRPTVKEAMEDKWLNEGFQQKPLNAVSFRNRLRPDELNPIVLNYMSESLDLSISEIINTLVNNRPSPVTASYYLLQKKLLKHQKEKGVLKEKGSDKWNLPSTMLWVETTESNTSTKKIHLENEVSVPKHDRHTKNAKTETKAEQTALPNERKEFMKERSPVVHDPIQEEEIAIILDNQENVLEAPQFSGKEVIFLDPPNTSTPQKSNANVKQAAMNSKHQNEVNSHQDNPEEKQNTFVKETNQVAVEHNQQTPNAEVTGLYSGKALPKRVNKLVIHVPPSQKQGVRLRELLKPVDDNIPTTCCQQQDKESLNLVMIDTSNHSPLPRLRQPAFRDAFTRRISWMSATHHAKSGSPPFVINGSRPPVFPMSRQQTFMVRSLRQSREKSQIPLDNSKVKRNVIQLKQTNKPTDLNLPLLLPSYQKRSDKKNEILRLEFT